MVQYNSRNLVYNYLDTSEGLQTSWGWGIASHTYTHIFSLAKPSAFPQGLQQASVDPAWNPGLSGSAVKPSMAPRFSLGCAVLPQDNEESQVVLLRRPTWLLGSPELMLLGPDQLLDCASNTVPVLPYQ